MESRLGFEQEIVALDEQESTSSDFKSVPWLSWEEWEFVRESLFSSSPDKVASALDRISTWRIRGSLPPAVDVTASIIEIQQKDGLRSRENQPIDALCSEHLLQMLYCMAILRLVNCVIEKTRKRNAISIAKAAEAIGLSRKLIDIRHEGSHRELPALSVLRDSADEALAWLNSYYWEPQRQQILFKGDGSANIINEIRSKFHDLALCLKVRQSHQLGSPVVKRKGSNKRIGKAVNILVQLYSSFSSEVISVLLEILVEALDSNSVELPKDHKNGQILDRRLDEWNLLVMEFSNKEPEVLLALLQTVFSLIESTEQRKYGLEEPVESECKLKKSQVQYLPFLFAWLVGHLKRHLLKHNVSSEINISGAISVEFLRKCLLLSVSNNQLKESVLQLSELMGGPTWKQKLKKLSSIHKSSEHDPKENSFLLVPCTLTHQEKSIQDAAKELELIKLRRMKSKAIATKEDSFENSNRSWVKVKTWNPCPIGMLPRVLGSSGRVPLLNYPEKQQDTLPSSTHVSVLNLSEKHENVENSSNNVNRWELRPCSGKREANPDIYELDDSKVKRVRETNPPIDSEDEFKGCLRLDGGLKKVSQEEVLAIQSALWQIV